MANWQRAVDCSQWGACFKERHVIRLFLHAVKAENEPAADFATMVTA